MAKKLSEIEELIESQSKDFYNYFKKNVPDLLMEKIKNMSTETDVYLFSGLIRNYFLHNYDYRDIDLVLAGQIDIQKYFSNSKIQKNSFDGYKIFFDNIPIDVWVAKDSWAYKFQQSFNFDLAKFIFQTAYFNFSAIVYSLNEEKFYYSKHFLRFLQNKEMDIVFSPNKNYDLCIINTIYYNEKYGLKISKNLANEILKHYYTHNHDFEKVQKNHFGEVKYDLKKINDFVKTMLLKPWYPNIAKYESLHSEWFADNIDKH